jgi:hypothetical protein
MPSASSFKGLSPEEVIVKTKGIDLLSLKARGMSEERDSTRNEMQEIVLLGFGLSSRKGRVWARRRYPKRGTQTLTPSVGTMRTDRDVQYRSGALVRVRDL